MLGEMSACGKDLLNLNLPGKACEESSICEGEGTVSFGKRWTYFLFNAFWPDEWTSCVKKALQLLRGSVACLD